MYVARSGCTVVLSKFMQLPIALTDCATVHCYLTLNYTAAYYYNSNVFMLVDNNDIHKLCILLLHRKSVVTFLWNDTQMIKMFKITVEQIIKVPVKVLYDEYFLFIADSNKPKFIKNVMIVCIALFLSLRDPLYL